MSKIEEMVSELCPDGVEYKKLGEIGTFTRGSGIQKRDFVPEGKPCIHYGQVYTHYGLFAVEAKSFISEELYASRKKANTGDLVIATTSENENDACKCVAWLGGEPCAVSGDACIFSHGQDPKYVAYLFCSGQFQEQKKRYITGTKVLRVSGESMARIELPFPPLEIQREVVRVLDSFAELEARKAQYAYYRQKLLGLDGDITFKLTPFGDCCESMNTGPFGSAVHKSDYVDGGHPLINPKDIVDGNILVGAQVSDEKYEELSRYIVQKNDMVVGRRGEMGRIAVVDDDSDGYLCGTGCFFLRPNERATPRYWKHFFMSDYAKKWLEANAVGGTMKNLNLGRIVTRCVAKV